MDADQAPQAPSIEETYSDYIDWKSWDDSLRFAAEDQALFAYFSRELVPVEQRIGAVHRVLEVGFGNGQFLAYARSRNWEVHGCELNRALVEKAQSAGYSAVTSESMATLPDQEFDLVVAFDVLEHVPQTEAIAFLSSMAKKLRPGGAMLLRFPNGDHWLGNVHQFGDPTHLTQVGYLKLDYFCQMAGLRIVGFKGMARRGFEHGVKMGLHRIVTAPFLWAYSTVMRLVYFPGLPVVLSSSDCVATIVVDAVRSSSKPVV